MNSIEVKGVTTVCFSLEFIAYCLKPKVIQFNNQFSFLQAWRNISELKLTSRPTYEVVEYRLFSKKFWDFLWEKIALVIEKHFWNWRVKAMNSLDQFIEAAKGQNIFWKRMLFKLIPEDFSD